MGKSYDENIVNAWLAENAILPPVYEHQFHPVRRWRFDLAWVTEKVAVEVQGGIWVKGRHVRGAALLKEWEKLNTAAGMGWKILYCQPHDLCSYEMVSYIKAALGRAL